MDEDFKFLLKRKEGNIYLSCDICLFLLKDKFFVLCDD